MSAYQSLEQTFEKISHLNHLAAIAGWDEAVMMPSGGGQSRSEAMATLQVMIHQLLCDERNGELIANAKSELNDKPWQQANLRWMEKLYIDATCLPEDLVRQKTQAAILCEQAWRGMREANDWQGFKPLLSEVFNLVKEAAQIRSEVVNKSVYDVLLDDFSPGIDQAMIDPIFTELKSFLPEVIPQIIEKQKNLPLKTMQGPFAVEKQKALGIELMRAIGFNFDNGRLDVSHHPFCGGVPRDVRITTRYQDNEFISSAMAVCHETGHAMYEFGLPDKWLDQPVGQGFGMSVHESQSLLIEMQTCRSMEFMRFMAPQVEKIFGKNDAYSAENLYRHYTLVKPDYIRVDADEVTYPLHVILRYELEQQLFSGELSIDDLPDAWNEKMQSYLGVSTEGNYKNGVMQDVHWPSAGFGYFPAYTLGALIAAQLYQTALKQQPNIPTEISQGNFSSLMIWLGENVHSKGSSLSFVDLMTEATGESLSAKYYIEHIEQRY